MCTGGARICRRLDPVPEGAKEFELLNRTDQEGLAPDDAFKLAPLAGGQTLEKAVELGAEEVIGDAREKGRHEGPEGEKRLDGILAAVMDGLGCAVEVVGELVGSTEDGVDELV
jgi:hypothetical protein